jgi:hypothetical protein
MEDHDDDSWARGGVPASPRGPQGADTGDFGGEGPGARMALLVLPRGVTLEVHVPGTRELLLRSA